MDYIYQLDLSKQSIPTDISLDWRRFVHQDLWGEKAAGDRNEKKAIIKIRGENIKKPFILTSFGRFKLVTSEIKDRIEMSGISIREFREVEIENSAFSKNVGRNFPTLYEMIPYNYGTIIPETNLGKQLKREDGSLYWEKWHLLFENKLEITLVKEKILGDYFTITENLGFPYITEKFKQLLAKDFSYLSFKPVIVHYV